MSFIPNHISVLQKKSPYQLQNLLNSSVIELDDIHYREFLELTSCNDINTKKSELVTFLKEQDFIIDSNYVYDSTQNLVEFTNGILHLTIMPTEKCNFRCVYCYEKFKNGRMANNIIAGLKKMIYDIIVHQEIHTVHISWFGGEPTLEPDIIILINNYVKSLIKNKDIKFYSTMTTNGYLLNIDLFSKLFKNGVSNYQITIDGTKHDKMRLLADGSPTRDVILSNIKEMLKTNFDFELFIRHNVLDEDVDKEWYDFLKNNIIKDDKRVSLELSPVVKLGGANDKNLNTITTDNDQKMKLHTNYPLSCSIPIIEQVTNAPISGVCKAAYRYGYVIRSSGIISKCTICLDYKNNEIGKIIDANFYFINKELEKKWIDSNLEKECLTCRSYVSCLNRCCPYRKMLYNTKIWCI